MSDMITPEELRQLCERIVKSGELGRSRTYAAILEYLAECAIKGTNPKEVAIAMDVLGRETDFDVGKDSIVRVHLYHLRSKLNAYFTKQGSTEKYRIDIPKGQYMLVSTLNTPSVAVPEQDESMGVKPGFKPSYTFILAAVAVVLLGINLFVVEEGAASAPPNPYLETALWEPLLNDQQPVLILVGDYYIMGEMDDSGDVTRMVREFDINSRQQLQNYRSTGKGEHYLNLDLSYTPTSTSNALLQVLKVFGNDTARVKVKMMSDFTTTDLVGNHIIYLGYLSGMQSLEDLMFAASNLAVGMTYDQLYNLDTDVTYTSSSGLSVGQSSYQDYGMLSTFPAPDGNQYVLLAGMRDEGLINLASEVSDLKELKVLEQSVGVEADDSVEEGFEALFEVLGYDNTNFEAKRVFSAKLDTDVVWETRLIGIP